MKNENDKIIKNGLSRWMRNIMSSSIALHMLATSRIEWMHLHNVWDYNDRYIGTEFQIEFDCDEIINISQEDWKKSLKDDAALRKLFQTARKAYHKRW